MVLGDNIFYGNGFRHILKEAVAWAAQGRATVFGCFVQDPERFGVIAFGEDGRAADIVEKPACPPSGYAVTGLYFYPAGVSARARQVRPSARGELEITDLNTMYLREGLLDVKLLGRGFAWMDAGTADGLMDASIFVQKVQQRQGVVISAPEEIAFVNGWIGRNALTASAARCGSSAYGEHLKSVAEGRLRY